MNPTVEQSLRRRLGLGLLAAVLSLAIVEGVLSWAYSFTKAWERSAPIAPGRAHAEHDPDLGWSNVPSVHVPDLYGPGRHFTSNSQRFRAHEDYPVAVPPGRRRVLFVGDSFTMGAGVGDDQTFPALVEAREPRIQSVNMGMSAYGVGQTFLRYRRDGASIDADAVVFAFIGHDFRRMQLDFYMAPKPRLALEDGELVAKNVPVPESDPSVRLARAAREFSQTLVLGKVARRALAWLPEPRPPALDFAPVAERIFLELRDLANERGHEVVMLHLPVRYELDAPPVLEAWLRRVSSDLDLPLVDLWPVFASLGAMERAAAYQSDRHFSPEGNDRVARRILPLLRERLEMGDPSPAGAE